MRMIVAGGGTGGHFFPGLAVAEAATAAGHSAIFVGSSSGIEARIAPQRGFPFVPLEIHGLRGSGWRGGLRFACQLPVALCRAWRELRRSQAEVVLGLGGYGSVPVVVSAWLRGVPAVLMEQNVHPGLANRSLSRLARRVCTTFSESDRFFPSSKSVRTGNPVRNLVSAATPDPNHFTLLVFGGSQGARSLNQAIAAAAHRLHSEIGSLRIVHQTGAANIEPIAEAYREAGVVATVSAFIDDMAAAYGQADLVVCRAGATTLAELAALEKPSILIPYPFAADDHQRHNAESLVARGAAEMILDRDLAGGRLADRIVYYAGHRNELAAMGRAAGTLAAPNATIDVLRVCATVVAEGN